MYTAEQDQYGDWHILDPDDVIIVTLTNVDDVNALLSHLNR